MLLKKGKEKIEKQMELAERTLNQKVLTFFLMTILRRRGGLSDWE
jgi:phosphopantetheine adenylyltransferase